FYHFVGKRKQRRRQIEAERLRDLEIEHKFEFYRRRRRRVARLPTLEDTIDVRGGTSEYIQRVRRIRHQATSGGEFCKPTRSPHRRWRAVYRARRDRAPLWP